MSEDNGHEATLKKDSGPPIANSSETLLQRIIERINANVRPEMSVPWKVDEPHPQNYYTYSRDQNSWIPFQYRWQAVETTAEAATTSAAADSQIDAQLKVKVEAGAGAGAESQSDSPSTTITKIMLLSWNIDFMAPFSDERMSAAISHLEELLPSNYSPSSARVILLQEMMPSDLELLTASNWVRQNYNMSDVDESNWGNGHYGTVTLIHKSLPITKVFRVHYSASDMQRDGLFVDVLVSSPTPEKPVTVRICNTHLESLIAEPPLRPTQLSLASQFMHDPAVHGALLAGDLNAIEPFDRTLHHDNSLSDAFLSLGGQEGTDESYTWGITAPIKQRQRFGCSRMDKVLFCGGVACKSFEKFGKIEVSDQRLRKYLMLGQGTDGGWVTDHLGIRAEFDVVDVSV